MAYIGQTLTEGTRRVYTYTATASQTDFNAVYGVGAVDVYQNGVLLAPADYTATTGTTVVLGTGAALDDEITIVCHNTFSVADTLTASQGGAFNAALEVNADFTVDTDTLHVDSTNDRVGIGTTSPLANLEIVQSGNNVGLLVAGGGYNYTAKFESSDAEANIIIEDSNSTNDGNRIGVATNDMYFITDNSERMRIDSSGNVGIGTTSTSTNYGAYKTPLIVEHPQGYGYVEIRSGTSNNQAGLVINRQNNTGWLNAMQNNGRLRIAPMSSIDQTGLTNAKDGHEGITIGTAGDVGIANQNPQRKLVVSENGANGIELDPNISGQSEIISYNRSNSQYTPLNVAASVISLNDRVGIKTSSLRDGVVHEIQSGITGYGNGVITRIGQVYTYTRNFTNTGAANNPIQIVIIGYDHNNWSSQYFKVEVFNDYYSSGGEAAYILDANGNTARQLYANNVQGSFSTSYVQVHNNLSRRTFTWNGNQYRSYGFRCTFGMTAVNVDPAASQVRLS